LTEPKPDNPELAPSPLPSPPASTSRRVIPILVAATVIVVDQISKLFIEHWLPLNQWWAPLPEYADYFRIAHVANTGAAFGLFPSGSMLFTVVAVVVSLLILLYNFQLVGRHFWLRVALGLQLGGALGNLLDRLRLGHVTDFLDFGPWPVFNVADAAIVSGVVILGILLFFEQEHEQESAVGDAALDDDDGESQPSVHNLQAARRQNEQAT
jgi:signal peptidase II